MAKKSTSRKSRSASSRKSRSASSRKVDAAGKQLVVVESPAKARTINKYLGPDYVVLASVGHVRDLPSRNPKGVKAPVPGVDLDKDFAPTYEVIKGKGTTVTELARAAKKADGVWLATDLDREGEAIAWHLAESLGIEPAQVRRVVFNAITKNEIQQAFTHPRPLDMDKVNAQQARRILDRIVGYQVSPLLWKKVAGGLSAGRVQSVAVRLIVEREREIRAFTPDEFWKITGYFTADTSRGIELARQWQAWRSAAAHADTDNGETNGSSQRTQRDRLAWLAEHAGLMAELVEFDGGKFEPKNADQALAAAQMLGFVLDDRQLTDNPRGKGPAAQRLTLAGHLEKPPHFAIESVETKRTSARPYAPFITSTLQQAAANRMGFPAATTMRLAQQLYEGVEVRGLGSVGLITYMRTDSTHLSGEAIGQARDYIGSTFGGDYLPDKPNFYASTNRDAQQAHEAIRPTDVSLSPDDPRIKASLDERQLKLYRLIWQRFVSCQMTPAQWDATTVRIVAERDGRKAVFRTSGRTLVFDGFYKVVGAPHPADEAILPPLSEGQALAPLQIDPTQHFTSPPPRYTEASLVKKLEAEGIGRPSTYAAIIQVIQNRKYVEKIRNRFHATDLGEVVTDKLLEAFPRIMDVGYTRWMEEELDAVEQQHHDWVAFLHKFYGPFREDLDRAHEELTHAKAETQPAPDEYKCPECGAATVYRFGRNGRFLSCSRYPDCKYAAPVDREGKPQPPQTTDIACPKCASALILRKGRFGPFLSCSRYPDCDGIVNLDKKGHIKHPTPPPLQTDMPCPKCGEPLNLRRSARGPWLSCSAFPKCRGRAAWSKLDEADQKKWELALMNWEKQHPQPTITKLDGTPVGDDCTPQTPDGGASGDDDTPADSDAA